MLWRGYGETDFALRSLAVMGNFHGPARRSLALAALDMMAATASEGGRLAQW